MTPYYKNRPTSHMTHIDLRHPTKKTKHKNIAVGARYGLCSKKLELIFFEIAEEKNKSRIFFLHDAEEE